MRVTEHSRFPAVAANDDRVFFAPAALHNPIPSGAASAVPKPWHRFDPVCVITWLILAPASAGVVVYWLCRAAYALWRLITCL